MFCPIVNLPTMVIASKVIFIVSCLCGSLHLSGKISWKSDCAPTIPLQLRSAIVCRLSCTTLGICDRTSFWGCANSHGWQLDCRRMSLCTQGSSPREGWVILHWQCPAPAEKSVCAPRVRVPGRVCIVIITSNWDCLRTHANQRNAYILK